MGRFAFFWICIAAVRLYARLAPLLAEARLKPDRGKRPFRSTGNLVVSVPMTACLAALGLIGSAPIMSPASA